VKTYLSVSKGGWTYAASKRKGKQALEVYRIRQVVYLVWFYHCRYIGFPFFPKSYLQRDGKPVGIILGVITVGLGVLISNIKKAGDDIVARLDKLIERESQPNG
jgi:hypothetical protein